MSLVSNTYIRSHSCKRCSLPPPGNSPKWRRQFELTKKLIRITDYALWRFQRSDCELIISCVTGGEPRNMLSVAHHDLHAFSPTSCATSANTFNTATIIRSAQTHFICNPRKVCWSTLISIVILQKFEWMNCHIELKRATKTRVKNMLTLFNDNNLCISSAAKNDRPGWWKCIQR